MERTVSEKALERADQKDSLLQAQAATAKELENLTKLRIRDLLTDEEYLKQRQELERRQIGIAQRLEILNRDDSRFEPSRALVSLNSSLVSRFKAANLQQKRLILQIVGSNLVLKDENLNIAARKPFRRWSKTTTFSEMRAFVRDVRTFVSRQSPDTIEVLAGIKTLLDKSADHQETG